MASTLPASILAVMVASSAVERSYNRSGCIVLRGGWPRARPLSIPTPRREVRTAFTSLLRRGPCTRNPTMPELLRFVCEGTIGFVATAVAVHHSNST